MHIQQKYVLRRKKKHKMLVNRKQGKFSKGFTIVIGFSYNDNLK